MDFIKNMKKREFIEMGLKTLAALLAAFLAIILMEGMIYSIQLNTLKTKSESSVAISSSTIAYCIEESEDQYFVIYYNEDTSNSGAYEWSANKNDLKTREECEALSVKEVVYDAPSAFKFSITGIHYVVIALFVAVVAGYFVYRFIRLVKEYSKIEDNYKKTGTIEFNA